MRCFISIDLPKYIGRQIKKIQEELPNFKGKKVEVQHLHLTLKFLGNITSSKLEEVKKKLKEIKFDKFEASINGIGAFSKNEIRIVWLSISNCNELQRIIDDKLKGLLGPEQRFMAHLTIARVKSIKDKKRFIEKLNKINLEEIKFPVKSFRLKQSTLTPLGPIYEILERYELN